MCLALLLFFAGTVSMFELRRLGSTTQNILEASSRNLELSNRMLNAAQTQDNAVLQILVQNRAWCDSIYYAGKRAFDRALGEATVTVRDREELDSVYLAVEAYQRLAERAIRSSERLRERDFLDRYMEAYHLLTTQIRNYTVSSQNSIAQRTEMLEKNAYRAITPSIISLSVVILIVFMFYFLIDLYYIRPLLKINKSLGDYLNSKIPFNVEIEGHDELYALKEKIANLIALMKTRKNE